MTTIDVAKVCPDASHAKPRNPRTNAYRKVLDSRQRLVRGLWLRNGKFYANSTVSDELGRRSSQWVALSGATLDEGKSDYDRLLTERDDDRLPPLGPAPKLADFFNVQKQLLEVSGKRPSSVEKETTYLKHQNEKLGHPRLNKIQQCACEV